MTFPVTLVESNPVTEIAYPELASSSSTTYAGSQIVVGGEKATYGRELTYVFVTGASSGGNPEVTFGLQGRNPSGDWPHIDSRKVTFDSADEENNVVIMSINDHQLYQIGMDQDGVPFNKVRYRVTWAGSGSVYLAIYVIAGDLRYGLAGSNSDIADQMIGGSGGRAGDAISAVVIK